MIHGVITVCRNFPMLKEAMTASEAWTKNLCCDFFSLPFWIEFFIIFFCKNRLILNFFSILSMERIGRIYQLTAFTNRIQEYYQHKQKLQVFQEHCIFHISTPPCLVYTYTCDNDSVYVSDQTSGGKKTPNPSISNYNNKKLSCAQSKSLFYTKNL